MGSNTLPLRERKHAQTRITLLRAAIDTLESRPLSQLTVQELCDRALVSEATFFNYFRSKSDLLAYYGQLWGVEAAWRDRRGGRSGLAAIDALFDFAARGMQERPGLWGEVIAHQAQVCNKVEPPALSRAERRAAFPDLDDIESVPEQGLQAVLMPHLEVAVRRGELPPNTILPSALALLVAVFFGVPLTLRATNLNGIGHLYRQALGTLWAGLRARAERTGSAEPPA